jgi:hypothetical protein
VAFTRGELEWLAGDQYTGRSIGGSVYCGNCGYNLRTLPHVYTCPECGQSYNARPLTMKGIFQPHDAKIPFGDLAAMLLCGVASGWLIAGAISNGSRVWFLIGGALGILAIIFLIRARAEFVKLAKNREIARRIELEREGDS